MSALPYHGPIRYPHPLAPGSRVVVTAPSSGVQPALHARLDMCLADLRSRGFEVEEGRCLRDERQGASAPCSVVSVSLPLTSTLALCAHRLRASF